MGILLGAQDARARAAAGLALFLLAGALLVNQNLTAITALATGCAALLVLRFRRRAALPLAADYWEDDFYRAHFAPAERIVKPV